jgi:hypothetical protein
VIKRVCKLTVHCLDLLRMDTVKLTWSLLPSKQNPLLLFSDVVYRKIDTREIRVIRTLAQLADLARFARSNSKLLTRPGIIHSPTKHVIASQISDASILDGCTFKLDSSTCHSLRTFLNSQPSLTDITTFQHSSFNCN